MNTMKRIQLLAITLLTLNTAVHATVIYSEDFNASTEVLNFSDSLGVYSSELSTKYNLSLPDTGIAPSMIELPTLTGNDFVITSLFIPLEGTGKGTLGFAAFGNDDSISASYYEAYVQFNLVNATDLNISGVYLKEVGGDAKTIASNTSAITESTGTEFLFTLTGNYDINGDLSLSFNVNGGATNTTISGIDTSPLTGSYYGYRATKSAGPTKADMDNFLVTIPEPSSIVLVAISGLVLLLCRTRQRRR